MKEIGLNLIISTVLAFPADTEEIRENYASITDFAWGIAPIDLQWGVIKMFSAEMFSLFVACFTYR